MTNRPHLSLPTPLSIRSARGATRSARGARVAALALAGFCALGVTRPARAQELAYCDLSVAQQAARLQLNGATVVSAGARKAQGIVVTPELANQRSTVFHSLPIGFVAGDSLYQHFRVRISGAGGNAPPNGADGFAFMVQNDPGGDPLGEGKTGAGVTAVGRNGEGFAYAGITQSVALELDTFFNAVRHDPNGNHLGWDLGGHTYHTTTGAAAGAVLAGLAENSTAVSFQPIDLAVAHSLESTAASFDTRDVWIDYVCAAGTCSTKVYMTFNNAVLAANFADPTIPASTPAKPVTPILTVNGLNDIVQYLNGGSGFAGFSASTGGNMDQHLVTYWVLSKTPFSDANTNHVEDLCDCRNVPAACAGHIPICDLTTPQGYCRECKSNAECTAKDPTKPACDLVASGGTGGCVECTSGATCSAQKPNCNLGTNTCTAGCTTDAQCPTAQWCSNATGAAFAGTCTAKLANGTPIPILANHAPVLNGACTAQVGAAVCFTGVCDATDNKCGIAPGDGTCTVVGQCRAGLCIATGANAEKCEPCIADVTCTGATPACNVPTNQCVQCTATKTTACVGVTPICNTTTHACAPCNGNAGTGATSACPVASPFCTVATGACSALCTTDAQCGAGNWCNNLTGTGTCAPKQANGTPVPGGACGATLGTRACQSAVCDTTDAKCGYAEGDGPCASIGQCRAGVCVTIGANAAKCEPCQTDGNCGGVTPACNAATDHCVQCTATNGTACAGATPFCDITTSTCSGCTSDHGVASAHACAQVGAPYCAAGGLCGHCGTSTDCAGATHSGPYCVSGTCSPTCTSDQNCSAVQWCDGAGVCDPKVPNGSPLPTTAPIDAKCSVVNGERVCLSGVCDVTDEKCGIGNGNVPPNDGGGSACRSDVVGSDGKCGYPNDEGPCTTTNETTVCRSALCDPTDGKCGLPNGEGPCTLIDEQKVCRSGACDVVDGKCGIDNGSPPPNDGGRPECRSGVVGSDGKCGYPNGEGPCSMLSGPVVCRSGACDAGKGTCGTNDAGVPLKDAGSPKSDASVPSVDSGRIPTVDGGTCPSGAIGSDGKCGYPNGEGPCTTGSAATVCRSLACNAGDGKCGYPVGTGSCPGGATVCRAGVCDGTGVCGCASDVECGSATSGRICSTDTHDCTDGCRGSGGNGCPTSETCSSTTSDVGSCRTPGVTDSLAGGGCACTVPTRTLGEFDGRAVALGLGAVVGLARRRRQSRRRGARRRS